MKTTFYTFIFMLLSINSMAQERMHYRDAVLKTNLFSPISLGIEVPFKEDFTIEYSIRRAHTFIFSRNTYRDERLNFKYHIPFKGLLDLKRSAYFMLGLHSKYQEMNNKVARSGAKEYGLLNQNRFVYGLGMRSKYFDVWIAAERVFFERNNLYQFTDADGKTGNATLWKNGGSISIGLSYNFLNFSNLKIKSR